MITHTSPPAWAAKPFWYIRHGHLLVAGIILTMLVALGCAAAGLVIAVERVLP